MKLTRENRRTLEIGDVLKKGNEVCTIWDITIYRNGGMFISARDQYGRNMYMFPAKLFYGMEIEKR